MVPDQSKTSIGMEYFCNESDSTWKMTDEEYLNMVRKEFMPRARSFKPDMILHNLGHDTSEGDYGDLGLTSNFFLRLAKEINELAKEVCGGRYLVLTHGGDRADVADYIFPEILKILATGD